MFEVIAGTYNGIDKVCKYSEIFHSLDAAIVASDEASGYPWQHIMYNGRVLGVLWDGYHPFD